MNPLIALLKAGRILPAPLARRIGAGLGGLFAIVGGREPKRAAQHLAQAYPEWPPEQVQRTVRALFRHMGAMALETLSELGRDPAGRTRGVMMEGAEHVRAFLAASRRGEGTVVFTAHFGNWELMGRLAGLFLPITVVGRRLRSPLADAAVKWLRTSTGAQQVDQQQGIRPLLRAIREGRAVACLSDNDVPALAGAFVPWFGHLAYTPIGPAGLAAATGSAMQVMLTFRAHGRWVVHAGPRWPWPGGERDAAVLAMTARATAYLEVQIRRHPEQWMWFHKRWRTRPADRPHAPIVERPSA